MGSTRTTSMRTMVGRISRHPATRAVARCAVMCAAAAIRPYPDRPNTRRDTPGGHNRGCST
ncbi:hypothetical protein MLGJGCBP_08699 [Rhodococcus sp. T7]|nr:hypothetical protein MLGJGCBP_08699 [Rhodococcus sp. T7]